MKILKKQLKFEKQYTEASGQKVALYFHDEAGFSLTTDIGYTWYQAGERPELKASTSRPYWHLSAAANPETGDISSMLLPWLNTDSFQIYLEHFAEEVESLIDEGYEIWLAVDRAGWHISKDLKVPRGIKLIFMPTGAATINPIETLWEFIRKNFTRNKIHKNLQELENTLVEACTYLTKSAQKVASICYTSIIGKAHMLG